MKILRKLLWSLLPVAALAVTSCGGSEDEPAPGPVNPGSGEVKFGAIASSEIGETSFVLSVEVTSTASIVNSGFCYATTANPTTANDKLTVTAAYGKMSGTVSNLNPGTTYYVRAYAVVGKETTYSAQAIVATTAPTTITPQEVLNYRGPAYPDDYRQMAGWDRRADWNLANVHDPTVMLADDGYYYMYQTDASFGNAHTAGGHFHGRRSKDLVNWEYLGGTMKESPRWINEKVNEYRASLGLAPVTIDPATQGFWAPVVRNVGGGLYRMYYSVVNDGTLIEPGAWPERSFIGLMETRDPASNIWEDKGFVICAASDRGTDWKRPNNSWNAYNRFNAIDPTMVITPSGEHWLIYGSWHCGFAAVQLDPATGKTLNPLPDPWGTADDIAPYGKLVNTRNKNSRWQGSEGPEVVYRNGYYYMFMAYDELAVAYNTRVVRSTSPDGPYVDMYGTNVSDFGGDAYPIMTHPYKFNDSPGWVGISHCAVFSDGNDNWFFSSQGRFPNGYDDWAPNAIMLGHVRSIIWTKDDWPLVMPERYGAVPQIAITAAEIPGTWEHIDLSYKFGEQRASSLMVFAPDGTISSGIWKGGKWSFDEASQILTANGVELYLKRECNWEGKDRRATIVYAGLGNKKTYWGKQVN